MKFAQLMFAMNIIFLRDLDAQVQEKNDHLMCFGVKDSETFNIKKMIMNANRVQAEYNTINCKIKKKGSIRFCVPSTKVVKKGKHDPTLGGLVPNYDPNRCIQNDFLCYKVKCKNPFPNGKTQLVKDQFGSTESRELTVKNQIEICTPAWKVDEVGDIVLNDPCPTPTTEKPSSYSPTIAPTVKECDQTRACSSRDGGKCVLKNACVPSPFIECIDSLCNSQDDCTCNVSKCYQEDNDECSNRGGECIKNCDQYPFMDCLDICKNEDPTSEDRCKCAVKKIDCKQKTECTDAKGKCIPKVDCVPSLFQECDDSLCFEEDECTCLKPKCYQEQGDKCSVEGGRCIKNCDQVVVSNPNLNCLDICHNKSDTNFKEKCKCLVKNPKCVQSEDCTGVGGKCVPRSACIPTPFIECNDSLCEEDQECTCMKPVDIECRQKDDCTKAKGKCIPKGDCVPSPFQDCDNSLCFEENGCTCAKPKCYQSIRDPCTQKKGRCIKDCREVISGQPNSGLQCEDICRNEPNSEDKCECLFKDLPCDQTPKCNDAKGNCMPKELCIPSPFIECDDSLCNNDEGCTCKKPVKECTQEKDCTDAEGRCIPKAECVPTLFQECDDSLCNKEEECTCSKPKCYQTADDECSQKKGKCIKNCKLVSSQSLNTDCLDICENDVSSDNKCECLVKTPPCMQTSDCDSAKGQCMPKSLCIPSPFFDCDQTLCDREAGCTCKKQKCYQVKGDQCSQEGGRCIKDCKPTSRVDCFDICKNDPHNEDKCQCEVKKTSCPQFGFDNCTKAGGRCIKNCTPSSTLSCKNLCLNFSTGDNKPECMCAVPNITNVCIQSIKGECTTKYKGRCKKNCIESKSTGCADVCKRLSGGTTTNRCFCEYKKMPQQCPSNDSCNAVGGKCVPKEDCVISETVGCNDKYCSEFDPVTCTCMYPIRF